MKAQFVYENLNEETAMVSLPKVLPLDKEDVLARLDRLRKEDELSEEEVQHFERTSDIRKSMGLGTIHLDKFEDVIITALEGGSNYWYSLEDDSFRDKLPAKTPERSALTERIAYALYTDPKFELPVYDVEEPDELLGKVTQESMYRAFEIAKRDYPEAYRNIIWEQYDAADADILFQLATMGELVFG